MICCKRPAEALRAEIAAQAARLGVTVHAAAALARGIGADAWKYFSSTGAQPLREDTRRRFPFGGIVFEEYNATVTFSIGTTETLIPAGEGIAFPLGTIDPFVTYGAPANLVETVNTVGMPCLSPPARPARR